MDKHYAPRPVAAWYMIGAVASLLFMGLGCVALVMHLSADPDTLPLDQRALFEAEPGWVLAASAVGFISGAIAALLLIMRRKQAVPLMGVSLIAVLVWFAGMFATPRFRDLLSTSQIALLMAVIAIAWTIYWFARHSRQRGWLR